MNENIRVIDVSDHAISNGGTWKNPEIHEFADGFSQRLQQGLRTRMLRREELARTVGVSLQHVNGWCSGRRLPAIALLPKICRALNVDAHWLMGLERDEDTLGDRQPFIMPGPAEGAEALEKAGDQLLEMSRRLWRQAQTNRLVERMDLR